VSVAGVLGVASPIEPSDQFKLSRDALFAFANMLFSLREIRPFGCRLTERLSRTFEDACSVSILGSFNGVLFLVGERLVVRRSLL
jgi:hypothetical protein